MLPDKVYLNACVDNGQERVGLSGGSAAIAQSLLTILNDLSPLAAVPNAIVQPSRSTLG